ncbi:GTP-binding protein [Tepidamorphus sp. 3E244]|uniref:sulfate adenylyltransferase subunit 1 n=1 Tax=Tepidamorphus sp. 3E244 TaxID=3385498 RepID=UPI0038FC366B
MTALAKQEAPLAPLLPRTLTEQVRVLMCGSVDDGKSTLIGRLLWDSSAVFDDQHATILQADGQPDFSRLVDGLTAEREQGITIDIAWRYLDVDDRRIVIIDSPGHEQYTRNMASGASHADLAVLLVDARHGIKTQTRRHAALLSLFGIRRVVVAINKMDLVDWSRERFEQIARDFEGVARGLAFTEVETVPISAKGGDNIVSRSAHTPWFGGPSLIDVLSVPQAELERDRSALRFPVQYVLREGRDFRGLAGTILSGQIAEGDAFRDAISGRSAKVARIVTMGGDLRIASAGQAVTIVPDRDLDISRGALLSAPDDAPTLADRVGARIVWLSETPYDPASGYLLRTGTDTVPLSKFDVTSHLDLATISEKPAEGCSSNDIAVVSARLARPVALDTFNAGLGTGSILIVDALTGATVAGGVVTEAAAADTTEDTGAFRLTRQMLGSGLCRDLGDAATDREEFRRRATEAANLLAAAGIAVDLSDVLKPNAKEDA